MLVTRTVLMVKFKSQCENFSYSGSAEQFTEILDYVEAHREEAVITRAGHESIVVLPLSEYESLRETTRLMNSPTNARRLIDSVAWLEQHIHKAGAVSSSKSSSMLLDKETAPDMGNDSIVYVPAERYTCCPLRFRPMGFSVRYCGAAANEASCIKTC